MQTIASCTSTPGSNLTCGYSTQRILNTPNLLHLVQNSNTKLAQCKALLEVENSLCLRPITYVAKQRPAGRRGSGSRNRDSPKWQLVEGRYKGNLASEDRRKGEGDGSGSGIADTALDGMSSPSSFNDLSKARLKVPSQSQNLITSV